MRKASRNFSISALLALGGCSQIIGLSDYEVDSKLDAGAGEGSQPEGGEPSSQGGSHTTAGTTNDEAGASPIAHGGQSGVEQGGQPPIAQAGQSDGGNGNEGGANLGELVPCNSALCCSQMGGRAVGVELLSDVGFEGGPVEDGNTAWTESSTNTIEIITPSDTDGSGLGFKAHGGGYYAYLSGLAGETSTIYSPDFVVPADAGWMTISGYRIFQVDLQDATNEDFCGVALYDPKEEDPAELPFFWGQPATHADGWGDQPSWKKFEASWDAEPHRGTTRYLGLRGSSDEYPANPPADDLDSSSYLFDDVSLKVFRCYK